MNEDKFNRFSDYKEPEARLKRPKMRLVTWAFLTVLLCTFKWPFSDHIAGVGLTNHVPRAIQMHVQGDVKKEEKLFNEYAPESVRNFYKELWFVPRSYRLSYLQECILGVKKSQERLVELGIDFNKLEEKSATKSIFFLSEKVVCMNANRLYFYKGFIEQLIYLLLLLAFIVYLTYRPRDEQRVS